MNKIEKTLSRRGFVKSTLGSAGLVGLSGLNIAARADDKDAEVVDAVMESNTDLPYIAMTEDGPLYPPVEIPWMDDLTSMNNGRASGRVLHLFGQVLTRHGRPLEDAIVEIWQTDINGYYLHPRAWGQDKLDPHFGYFGKVKTNREGYYGFKTIRPRWYSLPPFGGDTRGHIPRAAHIHIKVKHVEHGVSTTEAYFENASHEEIAPKDVVFLSRPKKVRDVIVLPENSPRDFRGIDIDFEKDSICCRYDMAFLL